MLSKQADDRLCVGDIVEDCNLVQNNMERDEAEEFPDSDENEEEEIHHDLKETLMAAGNRCRRRVQ